MTSVGAKQCPHCGTLTLLQAGLCPACGHRFRTRFIELPDPAEFEEGGIPPITPLHSVIRVKAPRSRGRAALMAAAAMFCLFALLWLGRSLGLPAPKLPLSPPASLSAAQAELTADPSEVPPAQAESLYSSIQLAMSLYDLDQTAGGLGRVIPVADQNALLLSYDYPDQSVHVLLLRSDVGANDYQVQTVALYRGKTLLQRHVDLD